MQDFVSTTRPAFHSPKRKIKICKLKYMKINFRAGVQLNYCNGGNHRMAIINAKRPILKLGWANQNRTTNQWQTTNYKDSHTRDA